MKQEATPTTF